MRTIFSLFPWKNGQYVVEKRWLKIFYFSKNCFLWDNTYIKRFSTLRRIEKYRSLLIWPARKSKMCWWLTIIFQLWNTVNFCVTWLFFCSIFLSFLPLFISICLYDLPLLLLPNYFFLTLWWFATSIVTMKHYTWS